MVNRQHGSPIEFRHDSMLRVEQAKEQDNATSANLKSSPPKRPLGYSVLRSGSTSGIEFAVLCITEPIVISGCAWLSVLHHSVRIFGHTIHRNHQPVFAVSAPLAPLLFKLSPCHLSATDTNCLKGGDTKRKQGPAALLHNQVKLSLASDFEVPDSSAAVLLISSSPQDEHLWKAADGFPESDDLAFSLSETLQHLSLPSFESFKSVLPSLRISLPAENTPSFEEWANWDCFLGEVKRFLDAHPASELRILVSGAGGSGKSTFVRCLSNHLATVCGGLVLIDTDVGQPELNLPGLVAAHEVSELHLGSAMPYIRGVPVTARLLGETTPRDDPDLYEACVARVSESGLAHATRLDFPVVINTDGWVSGAGSDFLNNVVEQTRPTHAICMLSGKTQTAGPRPSFGMKDSELNMFYFQRPMNESRPLYTRNVARELQISAYFCKELSLGRVRAVAIDRLPVILRGEGIDDIDHALLMMNGSIVALATSPILSKSQQADANVVGYGLVRGVSLENKIAYICSPIPPRVLKQSVALIICEHIHVPSAIMLCAASGSPECSASPFILRDHIDASHHMHSRSSLQRRATTTTDG